MTTVPSWRKASASGQDANCVEVHRDLDAVRDSKNTTGPVLTADVPALINAIRAGLGQ